MTKLRRVTVVQTILVLAVLAFLTTIFTLWVPLAQKTFSYPTSLKCFSADKVYVFHLHDGSNRKEYFQPTVKGSCGETFIYKLYL